MMRVLVTGANGMLATNIIEVLLERGFTVRGLLRRLSSYKGVLNDSLELIEGDFTDCNTLPAALKDCDTVIHSAAITVQNMLCYEDYLRVNVEATEQLVKFAHVYHIKKFVYVSSANSIGCGTTDSPGTEDTPCCHPLSNSLYGRSKAAGEKIVIEAGGIVVNPTFMLGRYGSVTGSNRILKMARQITVCPPGGKSFINVEDAARGVVAAMEWGRRGNKYLIAGENLLFKDFFRFFPQVQYILTLPRWMMLIAGFWGSVVRTFGIKTALSLTNAKILCLPGAYDNSKARRELGIELITKSISGTIDYLKNNI